MAKTIDPDGIETRVIHDLVDFTARDVFEVGCGDGRMTWRYASAARSVSGIDPAEELIAAARAGTPSQLAGRVSFRAEDISRVNPGTGAFDVVVLSWSL